MKLHEPTESIVLALTLAGGKNPFGEPNYRAVWGWNRLAWIGGKFEEHDPSTGSLLREVVELRQEPKYPAVNRWHIEKWLPAEAYGSPRAWWAQTLEIADGRSIPALGPYPARGEYEHCLTLEAPSSKGKCGEFVQLTATAAEHIARDRVVAKTFAIEVARFTLRTRRARRSRLRRLRVRHSRRRRSGVSSPAIRDGRIKRKTDGLSAARFNSTYDPEIFYHHQGVSAASVTLCRLKNK